MDALRSSMMLLGIVLHAALPYTTVHLRVQFKDPDTHVVFDMLVFFLHSFRMPLFFVAAGFFAGLLCERYGVRGMVRNRFLRIYVPFAVGWSCRLREWRNTLPRPSPRRAWCGLASKFFPGP
jgi:fucose 4-O-acetylase-like acetyltransferase